MEHCKFPSAQEPPGFLAERFLLIEMWNFLQKRKTKVNAEKNKKCIVLFGFKVNPTQSIPNVKGAEFAKPCLPFYRNKRVHTFATRVLN